MFALFFKLTYLLNLNFKLMQGLKKLFDFKYEKLLLLLIIQMDNWSSQSQVDSNGGSLF